LRPTDSICLYQCYAADEVIAGRVLHDFGAHRAGKLDRLAAIGSYLRCFTTGHGWYRYTKHQRHQRRCHPFCFLQNCFAKLFWTGVFADIMRCYPHWKMVGELGLAKSFTRVRKIAAAWQHALVSQTPLIFLDFNWQSLNTGQFIGLRGWNSGAQKPPLIP
jgi:hypothetical protein